MAVTYGFYNSLNADRRYNAEQISAIFDGVITDGVFASIGGALNTVIGEGMQVLVKSGKAWFNSTWTLNDASLALVIDTADVSLTRIDAVVLEVNSGINVRENSIKIVKGTPSANPAKPTMESSEDVHQYALAYVTVAANATEVTAADIEINVGKTTCPYVTSVLQQTDITDLFNQWDAEFNTWFSNVQLQLSGDVVTNLQRQIDELKIGKTAREQYGLTSTSPNDYIEWLGKYNEHWWSALHGETVYGYAKNEEEYVDTSSANYYKLMAIGVNSSSGEMKFQNSYCSLKYSERISIDQSTGTVSLKNPVTFAPTNHGFGDVFDPATDFSTLYSAISGKYVTGLYLSDYDNFSANHETASNDVFFIPENATFPPNPRTSREDDYDTVYVNKETSDGYVSQFTCLLSRAQNVTVKALKIAAEYRKLSDAGETTYEHSMERNAYPDSGSGITIDKTLGATETLTLAASGSSKTKTTTIKYSASYYYNTDSKTVELSSPSTATVSVNQDGVKTDEHSKLLGNYFTLDSGDTSTLIAGTIYYAYENAAYNEYEEEDYFSNSIEACEVEFTTGDADGITYTYLGVPFEKFPTAPQIETGSYVGAGVYDSSNKNELTFAFVPRIVFVGGVETGSGSKKYGNEAYFIRPLEYNVGLSGAGSLAMANMRLITAWNEKTMTWYNGNSAEYQLNTKNVEYYYVAIG